jgi:hypothetical protein
MMTVTYDDDALEGYEEIAPGQYAKRGADGKFEGTILTSERSKAMRAKGQQAQSSATELKVTRILQSRGLDIDDEFLRSLAESIALKRSNSVTAAQYLDKIAGMAPTNDTQSQSFEVVSSGSLVKVGGEYYLNTHILNAEEAKGLLDIIRAAKAKTASQPSASAPESAKNHAERG